MAATREIRRRIRGVRNIKQVTRAMHMIASARLRRAQAKAESARPYAERISEILEDVQASGAGVQHPLLASRPVHRVGLVVVSSDRGLCGGYNAVLLREVSLFLREQTAPLRLTTIGRKGRDFFRIRGMGVDHHYPQPSREMRLEELKPISKQVQADYLAGRVDRVHLAYSQFISIMRSQPVIVQLLPISPPPTPEKRARAAYEFEPAVEQLLDTLLPQYVDVLLYRALVESLASEQAARMIAMKAATDSADEMISTLIREYNRARQTSITTQILEVVTGAEALKPMH